MTILCTRLDGKSDGRSVDRSTRVSLCGSTWYVLDDGVPPGSDRANALGHVIPSVPRYGARQLGGRMVLKNSS